MFQGVSQYDMYIFRKGGNTVCIQYIYCSKKNTVYSVEGGEFRMYFLYRVLSHREGGEFRVYILYRVWSNREEGELRVYILYRVWS